MMLMLMLMLLLLVLLVVGRTEHTSGMCVHYDLSPQDGCHVEGVG
jgi:hypothetical protein